LDLPEAFAHSNEYKMPESLAPASIEHRRKRALYRATHRGTKELDWLLGRFAEARLPAMTDGDMNLFEQFLQVPDPELHAWIMQPQTLDGSGFSGLIHALRDYHEMTE
jgi:antitoxin CptB